MAEVNEEIVRRFFELSGFLVRADVRYFVKKGSPDSDIDLLVYNPRGKHTPPSNVVLKDAKDLLGIKCAAVEIKGWHEEKFHAGTARTNDFNFTGEQATKAVHKVFGEEEPFSRILVVSQLPPKNEMEVGRILKEEKNVDFVIEFPTILKYLAEKVEPNKNYRESEVLQVFRLLKRYEISFQPQHREPSP